MRASLHIITRDRNDCLALLLESLRNQTYKQFDVVILDNSEGQKVQQHFLCAAILQRLMLEGHRIHYEWIDVPKDKRDIGWLRNKVIEIDPWDKNEIGIRVDDDSICEPDYIELLMNGFTNTVGIVGGIVPYYWAEKTYKLPPPNFNEVPEFFYPWNDDCINFYRTDKDQYFESGHVRSSYAYRKDLMKKIRFEEWSGPTGFTEETVTCLKFWMNGYKVLINPQAICWHLAIPTGAGRDVLPQLDKMGAIRKMQIELNAYREKLKAPVKRYP